MDFSSFIFSVLIFVVVPFFVVVVFYGFFLCVWSFIYLKKTEGICFGFRTLLLLTCIGVFALLRSMLFFVSSGCVCVENAFFFSFCFRCSLENVPEKNLRSSSFFPSVYIENQTANIWSKMNIVFFLACSHIFLGFFHGPTRLSCTFVELFYLKTNFFVHHETQHKQINKTQWETKATQQYKRKDANKNIANH